MSTKRNLTSMSLPVSKVLNARKERIGCVESTTGGLIGASLLSVPGASSFFISSCVVYSGRGYKQHLPQDLLKKSGILDRSKNYANKESYVESKRVFVREVAQDMRKRLKADWFICESGTVGPEFYIPGVHEAFTAVSVVGPPKRAGEESLQWVKVFESKSPDREENMWSFTHASLEMLEQCMKEYDSKL
mmetsp:Transcript_1092/g.1391  ORF Transcript_1092/g.1391 Transcript_1092/m.1391 type:complete len:190 (+) Transcript_1092:149-718(+)|eukprot:CAMPEP_0204854638 /NCGR_PEP_ID=MMETSP1347-20130617/15448_1 /ASSEMBLY_ACC=CAM_ASM_000690 /TAXON_ID=215587 /ORGANISM="Aplanochytrium stocchinoi, Strain GSBS06" /LENGTH=189 /DNA_ID=CAMNT_0052000325 /DNA_START=88 /DNA_END=657 /DNA_ORIENTATION=+